MCEQSFLSSEGWCSFLSRDKENDVSAAPKPQKTRMGEAPHVPPCGRALHRIRQSRIHKNAIAFLLNTRGSHIAKTLLSPPQRGRRKRRTTLKKKTQIPNQYIPSLIPSAKAYGLRTCRPTENIPFIGTPLRTIQSLHSFFPSAEAYDLRTCRPTATEAGSRGDLQGGFPPSYALFWVRFFVA